MAFNFRRFYQHPVLSSEFYDMVAAYQSFLSHYCPNMS